MKKLMPREVAYAKAEKALLQEMPIQESECDSK
jgi:hypothetical protein